MILNKKIIKEIITGNYDLGEIIAIDPLDSGHESDNVKISTAKGEFVLKYFPRESDGMIETLILQNLLISRGVIIPKPIKTKTGDFVVEYSPKETITIQSFIPGEAIVFRENQKKMFKLMSWFGKHLGEFHFHSKSITEAELQQNISREDFFDLTSGLDWVKDQYSKAETQLPQHEKNEMVLKEFEIYLQEMDEIFNSNLTKGILQSDIKPGDFFVKNNEFTGILDFNSAYYSYLISELGTWVMYTSLYKPENKLHFQNFIKLYLEHSKLPIEELKYIPIFLKGRSFIQFFYFAYRCHNNITQGLDEGETNMDGFEDGVRLVESSLEIPKTYFLDLAQEALQK